MKRCGHDAYVNTQLTNLQHSTICLGASGKEQTPEPSNKYKDLFWGKSTGTELWKSKRQTSCQKESDTVTFTGSRIRNDQRSSSFLKQQRWCVISAGTGWTMLSRVWLVYSQRPSTGEWIKKKKALVGSRGVGGGGGPQGATQTGACVGSSWWTQELLSLKYVYIYSSMHVCACSGRVAAVLYGLTNMPLWVNSQGDSSSAQDVAAKSAKASKRAGWQKASAACSQSVPSVNSWNPRRAQLSLPIYHHGSVEERQEDESKAKCRILHLHRVGGGGGQLHSHTLLLSINRSSSVIPTVRQLGVNLSIFHKDGRTCAGLRVRTVNSRR